MMLDQQFREIIFQELKLRGWTQSRLADSMDAASSYVSLYLSGKISPGDDVKDRFFKALGLEPVLSVKRKPEAGSEPAKRSSRRKTSPAP